MHNNSILQSKVPLQEFQYNGFIIDCSTGKAEKKINGYKFTIKIGPPSHQNSQDIKDQLDKYSLSSIKSIVKSVDHSGILAPKSSNNGSIYKLIFTCNSTGKPTEIKTKCRDDKNKTNLKTFQDYQNEISTFENQIRHNGTDKDELLKRKANTEDIVKLMSSINTTSLFTPHVKSTTPTLNRTQAPKALPAKACEATIEKLPEPEKPSLLARAVTWIRSPANQLPEMFISLLLLPLAVAEVAIKEFNATKWTEISDIFDGINKVSLILLWDIPLKIYEFGKSLKNLYDVDKNNRTKLCDASLGAVGAFGSFVSIPNKIANAIEMFKPITKVGTWAPYLSIGSAILSVAGIVLSARNYASSNSLLTELERKSMEAYLKQLEIMVLNNELTPEVLESIGFKKNQNVSQVTEYIQGQLLVLERVKNESNAMEYIENIQKKLDAIQSADLKEKLIRAGDKAYIECLKENHAKDEDFLSKHFEVKSAKLGNRLQDISRIFEEKVSKEQNGLLQAGESSSSEYIRNAASNLKTRISDKLISETANFTKDSVSTVASILTLVPPALPFALIVLIGNTIFSVAKLYIDWERKKEFQEAMGLE